MRTCLLSITTKVVVKLLVGVKKSDEVDADEKVNYI